MKKITLDTKSNRYFDENGYLVIKDNKIAKAGVFDYLGREISDELQDSEIYKVCRPWAELEKTAKILAEHGFNPTLVDAKFVKPLDKEGYRNLFQSHHTIVTLENNSIVGGFGSEIAELLADMDFHDKKLIRFGLPDAFVEHGKIPDLYRMLGIDGTSIANKLLKDL